MIKVKLSKISAKFAVVSCLPILLSLQPASSEGVKRKSEDEAKRESQNKAKPKVNSKAQTMAKPVSKAHEHLVPPPPPDQPSLLLAPGSHNLPFEYEFMSKGMLCDRLKDLDKQIADAEHDLEEKISQAKATKEKSARFRDLYNEGVVSRRELEEAEKEAADSQRDIERYKSNVADLRGPERSDKTENSASDKANVRQKR